MKRRDFIKNVGTGLGAAILFPTIIPASALGKNGFVAPSNRLVMGSIGLGGMGGANTRNFLGNKKVQMLPLLLWLLLHFYSTKKPPCRSRTV